MPAHNYMNVVERILRRLPDATDDECWFTTYKPNATTGYVQIGSECKGPVRLLHRLVWEMHNAEPIPEGMVIMHSCDNPSCCNPSHLSAVSQSVNVNDSVAKGRHSCVNPRKSWTHK